MKRTNDAHFYAFNDDNSHAPDLRLPDHRLDGDRYRVRITLRGANADPIEQEFELSNGGAGSSITLTQRKA